MPEAALVAEICNLIYTHLQEPRVLRCEVQYAKFFKLKKIPVGFDAAGITEYSRVDLAIYPGKEKSCAPEFVIEVKRADASERLIQKDLKRLGAIKKTLPATRAFLFVVAEDHRPEMFVSKNGAARNGRTKLADGSYEVLRAYKAAWSYATENKDKCNYACIIEVFNN